MNERRFGRPLGEVSRMVLQLANAREVTCIDVASALQLSRSHASDTLYELKTRGYLREVDRRLVDGVSKPVPVVRAIAAGDPPAPSIGILALDWPARV